MTAIPTFKLNTGQNIPVVGLGTYKTELDPDRLRVAIKESIKNGYRHFDCAYAYLNENIIGETLHEAMKESNGTLKREDLFIVSKLWNTFHSREKALKIIDKQLCDYGFDYLDLYLIHWPISLAENTDELIPVNEKNEPLFSDVHYLETYKALEEIYAQGKVKAIGLSNFNIEQIKDVLKICQVKPAVLQIEVHPYFQNTELIEFCQSNDIQVVAYAPIGALDIPWRTKDDPILLDDDRLKQIASKYNKTPAQICLKWSIQRNCVVIPKSVTPSRIKENINIFDFEITDEDMQGIKKMERGHRYYYFKELRDHKYHPFPRG